QAILRSTKDSIYLLQIKLSAKKATISRPLLRNGEKLYLVNNQTFHGSFGMTYLMCQRRENNSDLCEANVFSIEDKLASGCGTDPKCVAPGTELPCKSFKAVILPEN